MKKIFIIATFLLSLPLLAIARQTDGGETSRPDTLRRQSLLSAGDKDRLIPVSREQAEILVTKLVTAALEADSIDRQRELDELVMRTKMEALKRKLIDEALARRYNAGLEQRLDRLEKLLMLQLVNNANVPADVLQTLLAPQTNTTAPVVLQPIAPAEPDTQKAPATEQETATPDSVKKEIEAP